MKPNAQAQIMKITPDIATDWLADKWGEQRGIRDGHVNRLALDMEAGRFVVSPDAILRVKGKLANGQHRLSAVVKTGKAQSFLVMESNDEQLYKVIDAGLKRTVGDALIGAPYHAVLPSIARWVQMYYAKMIMQSSRGASDMANGVQPTQRMLIEFCQEHQALLSEAATFVNPFYAKTKLMPQSIGGAIYVLASIHTGNVDKAKAFIEQVYDGGPSNSASDLRNRLISNKGSKAKVTLGYIFGITVKAFKSFCNGTRPAVLKWSKDEEFPTL